MPKIYVTFGSNTGNTPTSWSYNEFTVATSVAQISSDLLDDSNASTGVTLDITTAFSTQFWSGANATADAGTFPEAVLDGGWRSNNGTASTIEIGGLPNGASYTLELAGHTTSTGRDTKYTVEGVSKDYILGTVAAPTAPTSFTGTVDPDGIIVIDVELAATGEFYGYVSGFILDYSSGPTIDSSPASISPTESFSFTVSNPATAPTTGNTTGNFTGLTGIAPDSVTGSDPYTITWTLPRTTAKLFDATGYVFDITIDVESVSSSAIPYLPPSGSDYIDVGTIDTGAQAYTDYTGGTFVSTDQLVWDNSPSLSFTDDLNFVVTGTLSATVYRISSAGTVDIENTMSFTLGNDGIVTAVVSPMVSNIVSNMVN